MIRCASSREMDMRILCLGGGPAGLYFAISMKLRDASHEVTVLERNRANDTFGWGVVLSDDALSRMQKNDPKSTEAIRNNFAYWDDIAVVHDGHRTVSGGHGFAGIGRKRMLILLQERARELGVEMRFETEFRTAEEYRREYDLVIGCDGSFHGAHYQQQEHGIPVIGVPGTIDNDLYGTDHTIGYFTAVETALDAVDKLRDTGASHERIFVIEVMGRHAGHIALDVAVAGGAEEVFIPEDAKDVSCVLDVVKQSVAKGKTGSIIIVAEGYPGGAQGVADAIQAGTGMETRVSILGHIQRGGSPVSSDRVLASRLGEAAVYALMDGRSNVMVGRQNHGITFIPLNDTWEKRKDVNRDLYRCAKTLSV